MRKKGGRLLNTDFECHTTACGPGPDLVSHFLNTRVPVISVESATLGNSNSLMLRSRPYAWQIIPKGMCSESRDVFKFLGNK